MQSMYPFLFKPIYKDYLWGGDRIVRRFCRNEPPGIYAESWEVSAHPDGMSKVVNGPLAGITLAQLVDNFGERLLGTRVGKGPFPLLVKLIDSKDRLSVQVHPNDESAARYGGEAKTEMWYLVDADPDASVYAGLKPGTDPARFRQAIDDNDFGDVLRKIAVSAGDIIFIPGGRVHAIDRGCLILEVQQSSNTTYRIYDWGRVGADGKSRCLHIDQAEQVIVWDDEEDAKVHPHLIEKGEGGERWDLFTSAYFRMERFHVHGVFAMPPSPESFQIVFCEEGQAQLTWSEDKVELVPGTSCLIPAEVSECAVSALADHTILLRITVP